MRTRIPLIACVACLAGALSAGAGCTSISGSAPTSPEAHVAAGTETGRDTEAATRANDEGLKLLEKGELDLAAGAFRGAITADAAFGPAYNNLGKVYFRQKDWYNAAWEFEYAGKLLPKNAGPRNNLGLVLEQTGVLDRAVDSYREAVGLDAGNIEYRANLVRALIARGDRTAEVRDLLKQVLDRDTRLDWVVWASRQLSGMSDKRE